MSDTLDWKCTGPDAQWCAGIEALLPGIGPKLGLEKFFSRIHVIADATGRDESCWFTLETPRGQEELRPRLELHCSTSSFANVQPMKTTMETGAELWEHREGQYDVTPFDPLDFSLNRSEIFLYHNLLLAMDIVSGEVKPHTLARGQAQAFEAVWAVVVDGRLARTGMPGYPLAERRGKFSQLFSSAGVLMPSHWHIFQSLWDGGLASSKEVLAIIRQLPSL